MFQPLRQTLAAAQRHAVTRSYHSGRPLCTNGWVEIVEQKFDHKVKAWKFEDPDQTVSRIQEHVNSKGETLRVSKRARHANPSTYKKELNNKIAYDRKKKQLMDLIKYIHFVKDHRHKDNC